MSYEYHYPWVEHLIEDEEYGEIGEVQNYTVSNPFYYLVVEDDGDSWGYRIYGADSNVYVRRQFGFKSEKEAQVAAVEQLRTLLEWALRTLPQ